LKYHPLPSASHLKGEKKSMKTGNKKSPPFTGEAGWGNKIITTNLPIIVNSPLNFEFLIFKYGIHEYS
jgi:hypothetical protein